MVFDEKSAVNLTEVPLYTISCFFSCCFQDFLLLPFSPLTMIYLGADLFELTEIFGTDCLS